MHILLTGFGPFGNVVNNPTARLVEHFQAAGPAGHTLTTKILPVSYRGADKEIGRLLIEGGFDLAVLLGVAARSESVRLELFGRNRSSKIAKDAEGEATGGCVRVSGRPFYSATQKASGLLRVLQTNGIPARYSRSAGNYVCNHTYYAALDTIAAQGLGTRCFFVHMPCDEETVCSPSDTPLLPFPQQIRAIELILTELTGRLAPS